MEGFIWRDCFAYQWFLRQLYTMCVLLSGCISNINVLDHLNTELIRYSDPQCIQKGSFPIIECSIFKWCQNSEYVLHLFCQDICRGRTLPLDASTVTEYSLFPGQIVAAKLTNPNGSKLIAGKIWSDAR